MHMKLRIASLACVALLVVAVATGLAQRSAPPRPTSTSTQDTTARIVRPRRRF